MNWEDYHVRWRKQSRNSSESMPVGGGNIGCNVWVEENQIFIYIQQSGWFDENNSFLKAGRLRIKMNPCPLTEDFCQELMPENGYIEITAKGIAVQIWVDVHHPVLHIDYESEAKIGISVQYETWRDKEREVDNCSYELFQCKEMFFYPMRNPVFHKDSIRTGSDELFFYHQNDNQDLSFYKEFKDQGLEEFSEQAFNPQKDLVMGGIITGSGLKYSSEGQLKYQDTNCKFYEYRTCRPQTKGSVLAAFAYLHTKDVSELEKMLKGFLTDAEKSADTNFADSRNWWKQYLEKSFILGNPEQERYFEVIKNYQLFRFMMGCNYFGFWPTKFNGGLFTFDPSLGGKSPWSDDKLQYTPDFRLWGGGSHTIQNQRLLYWPMLKAGDIEPMRQHFDFFNRTLGISLQRCQKNFGIIGAMYPEQVGTYGLCCGCDNEWGNRTGLPVAQIKYNFSNSLETVLMLLEYFRFTGNSISQYIPFMENVVLFYHHFYSENDDNGKMILYPANALETYHVVKNPVDAIAGLHTVVSRMLDLPDSLFSMEKKAVFRVIKERIPGLKTKEKDGHTILAYADTKSPLCNCEIPELYTVFPYGEFGIGKENIKLAQDTARYAWQTEEQLSHISWHPTGIQYARLGMLPECEKFLFLKMGNGGFRFPSFWGPGHDWTPDHNWGGSGMIQLQEMLLQTQEKELRLLPCWNRDIDVHFKLHAPENTTVECIYREGKIEKLAVIPQSRQKDIILPEWLG